MDRPDVLRLCAVCAAGVSSVACVVVSCVLEYHDVRTPPFIAALAASALTLLPTLLLVDRRDLYPPPDRGRKQSDDGPA